jgi:hypothetical protein
MPMIKEHTDLLVDCPGARPVGGRSVLGGGQVIAGIAGREAGGRLACPARRPLGPARRRPSRASRLRHLARPRLGGTAAEGSAGIDARLATEARHQVRELA